MSAYDAVPSRGGIGVIVAELYAACSRPTANKMGAAALDRYGVVAASGYTGPARCEYAWRSEPIGDWVHAPINALLQCPYIDGGALYLTSAPCRACARAVANSGLIDRVLRY